MGVAKEVTSALTLTVQGQGRQWELVSTCGRGYLQAAEADHAVHHLGDTEAVAEVVEGVVLVVVMDTQLQRQRDGSEPQGRHKRAGGGGCEHLTSQRFSVMGLMLKSLTRPRSWYMCSRQLSICSQQHITPVVTI